MRKYVEHIGFLVVFIVLVTSIDRANRYMRDLINETYNYAVLGASVEILGLFIFGLFLGSLGFLCELKKDGYWKMNKERLLVLGLPLFMVMGNYIFGNNVATDDSEINVLYINK